MTQISIASLLTYISLSLFSDQVCFPFSSGWYFRKHCFAFVYSQYRDTIFAFKKGYGHFMVFSTSILNFFIQLLPDKEKS